MRRKSKRSKAAAAATPTGVAPVLAVTQYCQAIVTLVPSFTTSSVPSNIASLLNSVVSDAGSWMSDGYCTNVSQTVPSQVTALDPTFQAGISTIENNITALQQNPKNTAAQQQLISTLSSLSSQVATLGTAIASTQTQLTSYEATLQNDNGSIASALNIIATTTPNGTEDIQSVGGTLSTSFYTNSVMSPCLTIVEVDFSISEQLSSILSSNPPVVPLVMTQTLLQELAQSNAGVTTAMSTMLDTWSALAAKCSAVASDLQTATSQPAGSALQLLAIQTASTDWAQFVSYAQQLQSSN